MTTTLSHCWRTTDIIEIAPGLHAMEIRVFDPTIFSKSDIIILSYRYEMVLGYVYNITEDGILHIVPLNEMPTIPISANNLIGPVECTLDTLGFEVPHLNQLLAAIADRDVTEPHDAKDTKVPETSAERDFELAASEASAEGVVQKRDVRLTAGGALGRNPWTGCDRKLEPSRAVYFLKAMTISRPRGLRHTNSWLSTGSAKAPPAAKPTPRSALATRPPWRPLREPPDTPHPRPPWRPLRREPPALATDSPWRPPREPPDTHHKKKLRPCRSAASYRRLSLYKITS